MGFLLQFAADGSFRHFVDHLVCSSKRSHQQLQGTSRLISMASKRSCDPIDPTVAPPLPTRGVPQWKLSRVKKVQNELKVVSMFC
ncbi:unnamed protein product [Prunus armeniaca]